MSMVDLHTHSNASDGELTPIELIDLAGDSGVTILALTDHDTTAGLASAASHSAVRGIRFIAGVETEVEFKPGEFHLLGLNLDMERLGPLNNFLGDIRTRRVSRNQEMVALMQADGVDLSLKTIDNLAGGEVTGRLHFARWLIGQGRASSVADAFERWLGPQRPYYVPKIRPTLEQATDSIHDSGGKAVLAHPLSLWISWGRLKERIPEWKEKGLDGIEALHAGASMRKAERFTELASDSGLFITGGSDFHDTHRPDRRLGRGPKGLPLGDHLLAPFDNA